MRINWAERRIHRVYTVADLCVFRLHGEDPEVSTTHSAVATVVGASCHRSVRSRPELLVTCFQAVLESFWSETRKTLNCCSWTTEPTLVRSPKASLPQREQELSLVPRSSTSDSPTDRPNLRRSQLNEHFDCSNKRSEVNRWRNRKISAKVKSRLIGSPNSSQGRPSRVSNLQLCEYSTLCCLL